MWVLFYALISLLFIYIGHQAYLYVAQPYKKKKFVLSSQIEQYKSIIRELQEQTTHSLSESKGDFNDLETDLEEFMKSQM
jgi:hypothetical protein